jgi:hypothetical protein
LNGIRAAKYAVKAASIAVSLLIMVVVAGPIAGAVSPQLMTQQQPIGLGIDLNSINTQLSFFHNASTVSGPHDIAVNAFNNWPLPGSASLLLTIIVNNQTIYQTEPASVDLGAFQSGQLHITMDVPSSLISQLQGQKVGIGGKMSLAEGQFWTITVSFPQ